VLQDMGRSPHVRTWLLSSLIGGTAVDTLILYQVPATARAGLPLGIAAAVAGFRGLAQLAGRLPLTALTSKFGAHNTLVLAYAVSAAATLLLFAGGTLLPALLLSLFAGASIGAIYTLQGIYATNSSTRATSACCWASSKPSSPSAAPQVPPQQPRSSGLPAHTHRRSPSSQQDSPQQPAFSSSPGHVTRPQPASRVDLAIPCQEMAARRGANRSTRSAS
jgi:hypothetical protein